MEDLILRYDSSYDEYDECLEHHGIKGMHWGIRRYQNSDGTLTAAGKRRQRKREIKEIKRDRKSAVANRRQLSDDEIRRRIARLELERQLKTMTETNENPVKSFSKSLMGTASRRVATTVATGALLYSGKVYLTGKFDPKEAAAYMMPKPKNK